MAMQTGRGQLAWNWPMNERLLTMSDDGLEPERTRYVLNAVRRERETLRALEN